MPPSVSITPDAPSTAPVKPKVKRPSKLFVEYYASIFLFLIAAYIGLAFFVLLPIIQDIRMTNAEIQNQLRVAEQERGYLSTLEQSVAAAEGIPKETLAQVDRALPGKTELPSLLRQLGYASQKNNIKLDSLNILESKIVPAAQAGRAVTSSQLIVPVDISMTLRARNYFDVKRFLADIESNLRLMDVIGLTSSFSGSDFNYTLQIRTYLFARAGAL